MEEVAKLSSGINDGISFIFLNTNSNVLMKCVGVAAHTKGLATVMLVFFFIYLMPKSAFHAHIRGG